MNLQTWLAWVVYAAVSMVVYFWLLGLSYQLIDSDSSIDVLVGFAMLFFIVGFVVFFAIKGGRILWNRYHGYFGI
jgi:hypothetical protein